MIGIIAFPICHSSDKFTVNLFFCLGHAIGAAGIYLSWDKNQDKEITKDEVSKFSIFMCVYACFM